MNKNKRLYKAIEKNDYDSVLRCFNSSFFNLIKKANVNNRSEFKGVTLNKIKPYVTPLGLAVIKENKKIVELLIKMGADVNKKGWADDTPLYIACKNGNKEIAELLIEQNANLNSKNDRGYTSLMITIEIGHTEIAELLIDKGADINVRDLRKNSPLMLTLQLGYEKLAKKLLDKGATINIKNNDGMTPLLWVLEKGFLKIVEFLLDKGAKIDVKNNNNETPLKIALKKDYKKIAKRLTDMESDLNKKKERKKMDKSMMKALEDFDKKTAKLLIKKGADVNVRGRDKNTPLIIASEKGFYDIVKLLIDKGAEINVKNNSKDTPLYSAAEHGDNSIVKLLLNKGADINEKSVFGETPLVGASKMGREETVKLLLDNGADPNPVEFLLGSVIEKGYEEIAFMLIENGADVNVTFGGEGTTPLMSASSNGSKEVVEFLIKKGAKINSKDHHGNTALSLAKFCGHNEIVKLLQSKNKSTDTSEKSVNAEKFTEVQTKSPLEAVNAFPISEIKIALGAAFISCINETIQTVQSGSYNIRKASLNKDVTIKTRGCQLQSVDLDILTTAAKIALNTSLDGVSSKYAVKKDLLLSTFWPGTNNIVTTFSMTPERKFVWDLDIDEI